MKTKPKPIKPIIAYAIVSKKNPKIKAIDVFADKDFDLLAGELIIKVKIEPYDTRNDNRLAGAYKEMAVKIGKKVLRKKLSTNGAKKCLDN